MILLRSGNKRYTWKQVADRNASLSVKQDVTLQGNHRIGIRLQGDEHAYLLELDSPDAVRLRDWLNDHIVDGKIVFSIPTEGNHANL